MTGVLILAAGNSSRMGKDKQFLKIAGREVLLRSVEAYAGLPGIGTIVVVVRQGEEERGKALLSAFPQVIVAPVGGKTRQQSVENGCRFLSGCDYIAIHDGARPLVKKEDILKTIEEAKKYGGAVLGVMAKDTIKLLSEDEIAGTLDRGRLFIAQTPQVFAFADYQKAMAAAKTQRLDFTDDAQLFELTGRKVRAVIGHYSNIKVTTPEDMATAEAIYHWEERKIK